MTSYCRSSVGDLGKSQSAGYEWTPRRVESNSSYQTTPSICVSIFHQLLFPDSSLSAVLVNGQCKSMVRFFSIASPHVSSLCALQESAFPIHARPSEHYPASASFSLKNANYFGTTGSTFQMLSAYSLMHRSLEKKPMRLTLMMHFDNHSSWSLYASSTSACVLM